MQRKGIIWIIKFGVVLEKWKSFVNVSISLANLDNIFVLDVPHDFLADGGTAPWEGVDDDICGEKLESLDTLQDVNGCVLIP